LSTGAPFGGRTILTGAGAGEHDGDAVAAEPGETALGVLALGSGLAPLSAEHEVISPPAATAGTIQRHALRTRNVLSRTGSSRPSDRHLLPLRKSTSGEV
jgi:hypothetical protein